MSKPLLDFVPDKLESSAWDVARAIQNNRKPLGDDEADDLHVMLIEFAKQVQINAIRLCLRQISEAVRNKD